MSFPCPGCGHPQSCPCPACKSRRPTARPWVWVDGNTIACGGCGLTKPADWWMDAEGEYYKKQEVGND